MKYTVNTPEVIYRGPSLCTLLAVVFITLKLLGVSAVATWSWWWVLAPLWIPVVLAVGVLIIVTIILLIVAAVAACSK
jgi:hypothetical protein